MERTMNQSQDRKTSYHEAGHAVLAAVLHPMRLRYVTLRPRQTGLPESLVKLGGRRLGRADCHHPRHLNFFGVLNVMAMLYAGAAAERRVGARPTIFECWHD